MNTLDRYADRLYDAVESGAVSVENALRLLTMHQFTKHAHEVPLVNAKTNGKESVQSTESTSAYEKYRATHMLSNGEWDVDWDEFVKLMETPEGEAHFEPLMPRIQQEVTEAVRRTGRRRQMLKGLHTSQNRPTVGRVFNVLRWLYKAIRVFSLLGR